MAVFCLLEKLRYSNERSTKFESRARIEVFRSEENDKMIASQTSPKMESLYGLATKFLARVASVSVKHQKSLALYIHIFRAGKTPKILFFAPTAHGNACNAGYKILRVLNSAAFVSLPFGQFSAENSQTLVGILPFIQ